MDQKQIDKHLDEMVEKAEREIDIIFAKRLKALTERVADWYRRYADKGELNRTSLYQYNRFTKEMRFIGEQISEDYKQLYKDIQKLLQEQYLDQLLMSGYLYELEAQEPMDYQIPSVKTINQAILNPVAKLTLSSLLTNQRNEIVRSINIEIGQSLQAGEDYTTMAERLERVLGFSRVKARRVARTEAGRVQTTARLESAKHASKYANLTKVWSSTLDEKVRTAHRALDDQEADVDGYFHFKGHKAQGPHLFGVAKLDINCRCTVIFLVNGIRPDSRRARDTDGKNKVIPYQSFKDWHKGLKKGA